MTTTPKDYVQYMKLAQNEQDWNARTDAVKREFGGQYPQFWFFDIILSGVAEQVSKKWSKGE